MHQTDDIRRPAGFILAEALVALLILGVVLLALEGASTMILRRLAESERRTATAQLAETRREQLLSGRCTSSNGIDSSNTVDVAWSAMPSGRLLRISQEGHYKRLGADAVELYETTGPCR